MSELENILSRLLSVLRETAFAADEAITAIAGLQRKLREQPTVDANQSWFWDGQLRMLEKLHVQLLNEQERRAILLRDATSLLDAPLHKSESYHRVHRLIANVAKLAEATGYSASEVGKVVRICIQLEAESSEEMTRLDVAVRQYGCVATSMAGLCDLLVREIEQFIMLNTCAAPSKIFECEEAVLCKDGVERLDIDDSMFGLLESSQSVPPARQVPQPSAFPIAEPSGTSPNPQNSSKPKIAVPGSPPISMAQTLLPVAQAVVAACECTTHRQPSTILPGTTPDTPSQEKRSLFSFLKKRKKEPQAVAPPQMDKVQFSVVAPEKLVPGSYLPINIVMYEDTMRNVVEDILHCLGDRARENKSGYHEVPHNAVVRVVLTSADLAVDEGEEEQAWTGNYLNFSFAVKIPKNFDQAQALFTATVYINSIIATKLKLILDCDGPPKRNILMSRNDFLSAFVSYASQDRETVSMIVQGIRKARPDLQVFFDITTLRSGENWEKELKKNIDAADVLFLCWSSHAKESQWVDYEWRYAYVNKGVDFIDPIPLENPEKCPPPNELSSKHFNDLMLFLRK